VDAAALPPLVGLAGVAKDGTRGLGVFVGRDGVVRLSKLMHNEQSAGIASTHDSTLQNSQSTYITNQAIPSTYHPLTTWSLMRTGHRLCLHLPLNLRLDVSRSLESQSTRPSRSREEIRFVFVEQVGGCKCIESADGQTWRGMMPYDGVKRCQFSRL
jgi:hypothetical protein